MPRTIKVLSKFATKKDDGRKAKIGRFRYVRNDNR